MYGANWVVYARTHVRSDGPAKYAGRSVLQPNGLKLPSDGPTMFRIGRVLGGDCCSCATNMFIGIPYNSWVQGDPFTVDVFSAGGSVLGSSEGKLGAIDFSYERVHPLIDPSTYSFNNSPRCSMKALKDGSGLLTMGA
jgi:hypothetical protein